MSFTFASVTLAAGFAGCGCLMFLVFSQPNPPPKDPWRTDSLMRFQTQRLHEFQVAFLACWWLYHIILILFPPQRSSILCPHPEQISSKFFTWNRYVASYMALMLIAAPIRLLAFKQLGKSFTIQLARPKALVKTGLYAYCRHPSYTTLYACHVATFALIARWGGVSGCWIPSWLVEWRALELGWLFFLGLAGLVGLSVRVIEEEQMLRTVFGEEWEAYARKTTRFIPGIF